MTTLSVLDAAREAPRRVAVTDGRSEVVFAELAEQVRERMRELAALVQPPGRATSLVAVETDERPATLETLLALIELGIPFLPLHQRWSDSEREGLLAALPVSCVIEIGEAGALELAARPFAPSAHAAELLSSAPHLAALATSGSTGSPRVALLRRTAFVASAQASASHLGWHEGDRWLLCLPLAHVGGLSVVTRCLLARRTIVLVSPASSSASERLASAIRTAAPTLISMVPAQLDGLLELGPSFDLPATVRAILTGGAAASARLLAATADRGWPVLTSYGLTEACSQVATQRPGTVNRGERGVGVPLPGIGVRIEDGVIHIHGPTLASGYLGAGAEETISAERGFRTRDRGRFDAAGQLHVLGRIDDLIISGGENVTPSEVESLLEGCDGVLEACVFGADDARWGQIVVAGIRTGVTDVDALIASVDRRARERLASFKRPRFYVCAAEFVHNHTGKLDRAATIASLRAQLPAQSERDRRPSAQEPIP